MRSLSALLPKFSLVWPQKPQNRPLSIVDVPAGDNKQTREQRVTLRSYSNTTDIRPCMQQSQLDEAKVNFTKLPKPDFQRSVAVAVTVAVSAAKYVRITFIRKNSVAYVKITFSVSVSSPLPFIRSYRIEFFFSASAVRTRLELRPLFCAGNSAPFPLGLPRYCRAHAQAATA